MEQYKILQKIGEGTYGVVYKAKQRDVSSLSPPCDEPCKEAAGGAESDVGGTHNIPPLAKSSNLVAIKEIQINMNEDGIPVNAIREISLLKEIAHPNVIP